MKTDEYGAGLIRQLWQYRWEHFSDNMFDGRREPSPPVFTPDYAHNNVLLRPGAGDDEMRAVLDTIPMSKRHRFFGSMKSSQALAQSVFGNLAVLGKMDLLSTLAGDDGKPIFSQRTTSEIHAGFGYEVRYLREKARARSRVDVLLTQGSYRIAVECKLAESDFGRCSRPAPKPEASNYERNLFDGTSVQKQPTPFRCSLAKAGPGYWDYIPTLFPKWSATSDQCPCPLNRASQLTRSLLAAFVASDSSLDTTGGHTVLAYDVRNPSFSESGEAGRICNTVKHALGDPGLLQKVTWQQVVACLRKDDEMTWLVKGLAEKYGIE